MNHAVQTEAEHSFLDTLKNCAALFVSLSSALLIAFLAMRVMEFFTISMTANLPEDIRTVIVQALLFDIVALLKMLPFLFVPFLIICVITRTKSSRTWAYGVGGSIVVIVYAVLIKYFATAAIPLGADLFGYSMKEIETTVGGGLTIDSISIFLFVIPVAVFWALLKILHSRKSIKPSYAFVILGTGSCWLCTVSGLPARASFASESSYNLALNKVMYFTGESYAYFSRSGKRGQLC